MTNAIQTSEKTFNKNIKSQIIELLPTARSFRKLHIAGQGYVFFIKDENGNNLGKVFKEVMKGMMIYID